jgi:hypothetical protein
LYPTAIIQSNLGSIGTDDNGVCVGRWGEGSQGYRGYAQGQFAMNIHRNSPDVDLVILVNINAATPSAIATVLGASTLANDVDLAAFLIGCVAFTNDSAALVAVLHNTSAVNRAAASCAPLSQNLVDLLTALYGGIAISFNVDILGSLLHNGGVSTGGHSDGTQCGKT